MTDASAAGAALVAALERLRNRDGGWPYYAGRTSRLESTCWAALGAGVPLDDTPVLDWLRSDGLVVEPATGQVSYTFNALAALVGSANASIPVPMTARIVSALSTAYGEVVPPSPVIKQDTGLRGWSWTPGTFSWIEPTAWCLLAVKRWLPRSDAGEARIREAESVMRDRVCPGGGWNFGNGEVYGQGLPAHVPTTAAGVLALQDRRDEAIVQEAVAFLDAHAVGEGSTTALALTILAFLVIDHPTDACVAALLARYPDAIAFGNAAALGMAAYALRCAQEHRRATPFTLGADA